MSRPRGDGGSATLETVLVLPVVALVLLAVLQLVGVVRDELVAQEAARAGLRVAVTTRTLGPAVAAAREVAPDRQLTVRVLPQERRPGDLVRIEVRVAGRLGPLRTTAVGRAAGRVEPGAGG